MGKTRSKEVSKKKKATTKKAKTSLDCHDKILITLFILIVIVGIGYFINSRVESPSINACYSSPGGYFVAKVSRVYKYLDEIDFTRVSNYLEEKEQERDHEYFNDNYPNKVDCSTYEIVKESYNLSLTNDKLKERVKLLEEITIRLESKK